MDILIVAVLIAVVFAIGYLFASKKPAVEIDPVLAEKQLAEVEAQVEPEPAVLELTEEVKPKRTRKPRAAKTTEVKAAAKPKRKPRAKKSEQ